MAPLRVLSTSDFLRDYRAATPKLRALLKGEIRHFSDVVQERDRDWIRLYDRVEGLRPEVVLELEIGGACRALIVVRPRALLLWRFGTHDLVPLVVRNRVRVPEAEDCFELPSDFGEQPVRLLPESQGHVVVPRRGEEGPSWTYFLDDEQLTAASVIENGALDAVIENVTYCAVVAGGPGTGKTAIAVWLLNELAGLPDDYAIEFVCSPQMRHYVQTSIGWDLSDVWRHPGDTSSFRASVVIIDDPEDLKTLQRQIREGLAIDGPVNVAIVAVDPLQCARTVSDEEFDQLIEALEADAWWLETCYRQKEAVGAAAMEVAKIVARSTPFLAGAKKAKFAAEHRTLPARANSLRFVNPTGIVRSTSSYEPAVWTDHLHYLIKLKQAGQFWTHAPPLLVILDRKATLPSQWAQALGILGVTPLPLTDVQAIKGLEYQHVVLLLDDSTYRATQKGFEGSGQAHYAEYRRLRIPFTRARDTLGVFVVSGFPTDGLTSL